MEACRFISSLTENRAEIYLSSHDLWSVSCSENFANENGSHAAIYRQRPEAKGGKKTYAAGCSRLLGAAFPAVKRQRLVLRVSLSESKSHSFPSGLRAKAYGAVCSVSASNSEHEI